MSLIIFGASGHAKVVLEIAEDLKYSIVKLVDNNKSIGSLFGYQVTGDLDLNTENQYVIAIGDNFVRRSVCLQYFIGANFKKLIHPKSVISKRSVIEMGTVVMAGVIVNSDVTIGVHCILNTNCSVDHDCKIESFVHVGPNASVAGNVKIGEGTQIGIGACIKQGVNIGKWCTIGAGSVVIKDIPDFAVVVGNPGKIIKYNKYEL